MLIAGAVDHPALMSCIRMTDGSWAVRGKFEQLHTCGPTFAAAMNAWYAKQLPLPALPPLPVLGIPK